MAMLNNQRVHQVAPSLQVVWSQDIRWDGNEFIGKKGITTYFQAQSDIFTLEKQHVWKITCHGQHMVSDP